jgi:hypothetical protein
MAKKEGLKQLKEGILADCGSDVAFYMCNGAVLRSIRELAKAIEELDNDSFGCHVNKEKNDFATWIQDIFGDSTLAAELRRAKTQKKTVEVIRKRIKQLETA